MINSFIKHKISKVNNLNNLDFENLEKSKNVLFSIFTRYGDTIIDLVVIKEFIEKYPNKDYCLLCPKQMVPYVNIILPGIRVFGFNKRNIYEFIKVSIFLKREKFDVGFNPWSNGDDSCFWTSFCKSFFCYKKFVRPSIINHYEVVRKYLGLSSKEWVISDFKLAETYENIIICPESTDDMRSITSEELKLIIVNIKNKFPKAEITICSLDTKYKVNSCKYFKFSKSSKSSLDFINLVKNSDLSICVDSGPLHLMSALNIPTIAIFSITTKNIVLNTNTTIKILNKDDINDKNFI